ncbi:SRPBCC family protein [Halapricum hydrolyticum]|uniref:SRPBCC family protein n=1 Tax=Halapricum hydrolyticum TaxID=2979991 RepID=A0AAE3I877_9EURY|nr:SRPBCC family protein [Halapricum hydrolyticum]MCU4716967.1 SRPBCC family protein [Halapricum hydrolyticum]MCU4725428.1 SRPBCC family protein [Halapricum hydrolyticum]
MESVTVTRTIEAPPEEIEDVLADLEPFMRASGFDEVDVEGDRLEISKALGLLRISLTLEVYEDDEAALAYEQTEGNFESMTTTYALSEQDGETEVTAETEFALDAPGGSILDATVVQRQRRKELEAQLNYLEEELS